MSFNHSQNIPLKLLKEWLEKQPDDVEIGYAIDCFSPSIVLLAISSGKIIDTFNFVKKGGENNV